MNPEREEVSQNEQEARDRAESAISLFSANNPNIKLTHEQWRELENLVASQIYHVGDRT